MNFNQPKSSFRANRRRNLGGAGMRLAFNKRKGPEGPESFEDYGRYTLKRPRWQQ